MPRFTPAQKRELARFAEQGKLSAGSKIAPTVIGDIERRTPPPATMVAAEFWPVVPVPWVRESNKDKWSPRKRVLRYRAFRDEIALRRTRPPAPGDLVVFCMPMPASWSRSKRESLAGQPHTQVPDVDNLTKALLDACYGRDEHIWTLTSAKVWSRVPGIYIERRGPDLALPFHPEQYLDIPGE